MERGGKNVKNAPTIYRDDREMLESFLDQTEMNPKLWGKIGEDLVEKIITRLPPRNIVQSQLLSKKWRSHFQSSSFQQEANTLSSKCGPSIFYHPLCVTENGLSGYDRCVGKWKDLCTLPQFPLKNGLSRYDGRLRKWIDLYTLSQSPPDFDEEDKGVAGNRWRFWGRNCLVSGSLVFSGLQSWNDNTFHIFVTNVINKTVRRCPLLQLTEEQIYDGALKKHCHYWNTNHYFVHFVGRDHYKIVMFDRGGDYPVIIQFARVFDSKLNSWAKFQTVLPSDWVKAYNDVYIGGVVYLPYRTSDEAHNERVSTMVFCTFEVETGLFRKIIPPQPVSPSTFSGTLGAWKSQLVLATICNQLFDVQGVAIFTVNLKTLQLTTISIGPPPPEMFDKWLFPGCQLILASDSDCIHLILEPRHVYIGRGFSLDWEGSRVEERTFEEKSRLMTFNMNKRLWSYSSVDSCESGYERDGRMELCKEVMFQPNLSPFVLA